MGRLNRVRQAAQRLAVIAAVLTGGLGCSDPPPEAPETPAVEKAPAPTPTPLVVLKADGTLSHHAITASAVELSGAAQSIKHGTAILGVTAEKKAVVTTNDAIVWESEGASRRLKAGDHPTLTPDGTHLLWDTMDRRFEGGVMLRHHTVWALELSAPEGAEPTKLTSGAIVGFNADGSLVTQSQWAHVGPAGGAMGHRVDYHHTQLPGIPADNSSASIGRGAPGVVLVESPRWVFGRTHPLDSCNLTLEGEKVGSAACDSQVVVTATHIAWLEQRSADMMAVVQTRSGELVAELSAGKFSEFKHRDSLVLGPNARVAYVGTRQGQILRYDLPSKKSNALGNGHSLQLSPDGRWVGWLTDAGLELRNTEAASSKTVQGVSAFLFY